MNEERIKGLIFDVLKNEGPLGSQDIADAVVKRDPSLRHVEVKIAALSLVSRGELSMNDHWQIRLPTHSQTPSA